MQSYFINGLHITAHIGTKSWQKSVPQRILIDIALQTDNNSSRHQNSHTFNYENFSQQIIDKMSTAHWESLEIFGNQLIQHIQTIIPAQWLKITISIPNGLAHVQALGLILEQGKKECTA